MTPHPGSATVLVRAGTIPAHALPLLRAADVIYVGGGVDLLLGDAQAHDGVADEMATKAVVLLTDTPDAAVPGVPLLTTPGADLLTAAQVMDRLRSPGGCPWDAEQTHDSLKQYLVEECYELLEAIEDNDRPALREELGDVLLQVLFHARVAQEHPTDPFDVDDVATDLVTKLVTRHPHVFAGGDPAVSDSAAQQTRWEELKQQEKQRASAIDGVALGQPAVALAAKLVQRATRAGLPTDLLPSDNPLFTTTAQTKLSGTDPEGDLRAAARRFATAIRTAEAAAKADGHTTLTAEDWRRYWPTP